MKMTAETSLAAYAEEQPLILSQVERLKNVFRKYPTLQFTQPEIAWAFHWEANVAESRVSQLLRDGYIERAGEKVNWKTGHRVTAYKWKAKP